MLYDKFFSDDTYKTFKGDGGNEMYVEILEFIKNIEDKETITLIKEEIHHWLRIGRSSYFVIAVNLIGDLKLNEYKLEMKEIKLKIIRRDIFDIPDYYVEFIDESIKRMG